MFNHLSSLIAQAASKEDLAGQPMAKPGVDRKAKVGGLPRLCLAALDSAAALLPKSGLADDFRLNPNFNRPGNILISDQFNNRVIEVTRGDQIVHTFTAGGSLGAVAFASRLPDGDTLLTDAGNSRAVEVDASDNIVWQYNTDTDPLSVQAPLPTRAIRLRNGDTLISDQFNNRVIRVSSGGQLLMSYGLPLAGGDSIGNNVGYDVRTSQRGLYSPYDAKVVGDYTGLTPPLFFDQK